MEAEDKFSGKAQCLDVADLVPPHKLRMPFSSYYPSEGLRPLEPWRVDGSASRAKELLWVLAMNGRLKECEAWLAKKGFRRVTNGAMNQGGLGVDKRNSAGHTPLFLAAQRGHVEVCALLLDFGAHVDSTDLGERRPLHAASGNGRALQVVKLLLARGAHALHSYQGETAFMLAQRLGHADIAAALSPLKQQNEEIRKEKG
mmetsp:Transcript_42739/g.72780  ORF Transcript_42739/g.72780 Transcript_42739/m.72780 type:complete len:201 (-) Transcript_42739:119-721(-)